ncbi:PH adaptation potassium efflux system protein C [Caenispirillum salinarum AK4]|uniref:PH adaptation potassium efflux system protein C n=1 Tax=Caenispirillum salinarum AK4 TaxID=1238182 RepID=K9HR49_9PROT|nr:cation:proton antiporter subunit C [Caenispirillum salinarum]EKV30906.1 PH adaptation potassium efflux system protein C [Caenispirillum salinarum AK4]
MDNLLQIIIDHYNYWIVIILMMIGFYVVIARGNLVKKLVGLNIFQTSVFLLYISVGNVMGGTAPILVSEAAEARPDAQVLYTNPLTSVLILTAIVVGVATTSLGLALVVRIKESYGTMEEDEIIDMDQAEDKAERDRLRGPTPEEIAEGHPS